LRVTVVDDAFPEITSLTPPSELVEQTSFNVQLTAKDDVAIQTVELLWNGFTDRHTINAASVSNRSFSVLDRRSERVASNVQQPLKLRVIDSRGQVSEQTRNLRVVRDQAPNVQALQLSLPARGVYGGLVRLQLNNLRSLDDTAGYTLRVVQLIGEQRSELFNCLLETFGHNFRCSTGAQPWDSYNRDLRIPDGALPDDQYRLQVELTDRLRQTAHRPVQS